MATGRGTDFGRAAKTPPRFKLLRGVHVLFLLTQDTLAAIPIRDEVPPNPLQAPCTAKEAIQKESNPPCCAHTSTNKSRFCSSLLLFTWMEPALGFSTALHLTCPSPVIMVTWSQHPAAVQRSLWDTGIMPRCLTCDGFGGVFVPHLPWGIVE